MWPAILGMTYAALPESQGGARRRPDPRRGRDRQRDRPAPRRRADRRARAGAGSSSSTCRSPPSRCSSPGSRSTSRSREVDGRADRLRRASRPSRPACSCSWSRSTRRRTGASATRASSRCSSLAAVAARRLRLHRAADEGERADPERRAPQRATSARPASRCCSCRRCSSPPCSTRRSSWRRSSATRRSRPGVGMLPMLGTFAVVSFIAGPAYERLGAEGRGHHRGPGPARSGRSCSRWSTPTRATAR